MKDLVRASFRHSLPTLHALLLKSLTAVSQNQHSVAGRGVFSTKDLVAGEELIKIPYHAALTQGNGALNFPSIGKALLHLREQNSQQQQPSGSALRRLWNRIRRKQPPVAVAKETNAG